MLQKMVTGTILGTICAVSGYLIADQIPKFDHLWWAGYAGAVAEGQAGATADWLSVQLAAAQGEPAPSSPARMDNTLLTRLNAFQVAQGLKPDGLAGPLTLMQINRATGVVEPRLQPEK